ncbi:Putative Nutrient and stress factor 1 [Rhizopus microsporus]|nr:Putative Nutrient and stress factor 1 [Rhizopus microsporus]
MSQKKRGAKSRRTQKVYQCTGYGNCTMTFTRSEQLVRHLKRHRDEMPSVTTATTNTTTATATVNTFGDTSVIPTAVLPDNSIVYLDLTCSRQGHDQGDEDEDIVSPSTHDYAETMLYSFVDNSPHVADLLWSKQQLGQSAFLKLAPETNEELVLEIPHPTPSISTHDICLF